MSNLAVRMENAVTGSFFNMLVVQVKHRKLKFYLECHIRFVP